jgi:WD40 repeat protein
MCRSLIYCLHSWYRLRSPSVRQVFDMGSRDVLRTYRNIFKNPVHAVKFSGDGQHILAASDDKTLRQLNIPTESLVNSFFGHTDYVRCWSTLSPFPFPTCPLPSFRVLSADVDGKSPCSLELPSSPTTWVSGSYDHTVKMWDTRTKDCVATMNHGHPVEVRPTSCVSVYMWMCGSVFVKCSCDWDCCRLISLLLLFLFGSTGNMNHLFPQAVLALPSGGILISAGSNEIKIWDLLGTTAIIAVAHTHTRI